MSVKEEGWYPAAAARKGDCIIHKGVRALIEKVERIDNGPNYRIITDQGELIAGASASVAFLSLVHTEWKGHKRK